ncbi:CaiB/BaiF CoA transferase family protein, partial [Thermodesulfobacteriota bacterium]
VLAGWGACVVKIETNAAPCPLRSMGPFKDMIPGPNRSAFYTMPNPNKYGLSLNLGKPEGREVARRLIQWADVLTESYTPGSMKNWGLDYDEARKIKPDIVYFSTCMQGQTGPHSMFRGYGTHMAALGGFYHLTGWPDREAAGPYGAYTDFIALHYSEAVVLAAMDYRRRTGKGTYIDLSQIEAGLHFLGPVLLDLAAGQVTEMLQAVGVAAGPVNKSSDLFSDLQLKQRKAFVTLQHPEIGPHSYWSSGFKLSKTPEELSMPAPCLGEHNEHVLRELLGMNDDEIAEIAGAGVLE